MYEHQDITDMLEAAGLGHAGVDIFAYHSPPEVETCMIVYPSNDPPRIEPETPYYLRGKFQVIVRNPRYEDGLTLCRNIQDALTFYNVETPQMTVKECRPLFQPRTYRRSESGPIEFSITFQVIYVQK